MAQEKLDYGSAREVEDASGSDVSSRSPGATASAAPMTAPARPIRRSRRRRHCAKWWWLYLLLLVVVVLVIVLPIIFVGIPRLAQQGINDSTLNITSIVIDNPTPDSIHLVLDSTLSSSSSMHPMVSAFSAALSLVGSAVWGYITVPEVQAGSNVPIHVDQTVNLTNSSAFADYCTQLLSADSVSQMIAGDTEVHQSGLQPISVVYNKVEHLTGFNSLSGFNISSLALHTPSFSNGTNALGTASIPNPTVMTLNMGNVTVRTTVGSTVIGTAVLPDLVLVPGANTVPIAATVNTTAVLGLVASPSSSSGSSTKPGQLSVTITGDSVVANGQHLPYYETALQHLQVQTVLDVAAILKSAL